MPEDRIRRIETYLEHAEVRMLQADLADAEMGEQLYTEAADLLIQAEKLMKGSGAWLMACIHARRDNGALCVQWLERARGASLLPDVETIRTHAHFRNVRDRKWFKDWLRRGVKRN